MILFLFWRLQFTCAASGARGTGSPYVLSLRHSVGVLLHPVASGTTLLVISYVYEKE